MLAPSVPWKSAASAEKQKVKNEPNPKIGQWTLITKCWPQRYYLKKTSNEKTYCDDSSRDVYLAHLCRRQRARGISWHVGRQGHLERFRLQQGRPQLGPDKLQLVAQPRLPGVRSDRPSAGRRHAKRSQ